MELLFFLAYHNALDKFVANIEHEPNYEFGLSCAFPWSETIEGIYYWKRLDDTFAQWEWHYENVEYEGLI